MTTRCLRRLRRLRGHSARTLRALSGRPLGLVRPLPRDPAIGVLRVGRRRGGSFVSFVSYVTPSEQPSKGGEELLSKALDELQETQCLLYDQVECCSHPDLHHAGRLTHALFGRTVGRLGARRRARLPAFAGSEVQPTRDLVDLADSAVHGDLEDLVAGGRQQLPTGCTQWLRVALRAPPTTVSPTARPALVVVEVISSPFRAAHNRVPPARLR